MNLEAALKVMRQMEDAERDIDWGGIADAIEAALCSEPELRCTVTGCDDKWVGDNKPCGDPSCPVHGVAGVDYWVGQPTCGACSWCDGFIHKISPDCPVHGTAKGALPQAEFQRLVLEGLMAHCLENTKPSKEWFGAVNQALNRLEGKDEPNEG